MKAPRLILQCASFLLLLVFSQKVGAGLFLHNVLHNQDISQSSQPGKQDADTKGISFACNCIDDFLMPFEAGNEFHVQTPPTIYEDSCQELIINTVFRNSITASLRGPPSMMA